MQGFVSDHPKLQSTKDLLVSIGDANNLLSLIQMLITDTDHHSYSKTKCTSAASCYFAWTAHSTGYRMVIVLHRDVDFGPLL